MFIRVSICCKGPQVFPLVELSQGERQSKTYFLPQRADYIDVDVLLLSET